MKNIHIIPTLCSSKLGLHNNSLDYAPNFGFDEFNKSNNFRHNPVHLYITSDVRIKDVRPHKGKWHLEKGEILNKFPIYLTDLSECKLVIMTTDPHLIQDGVQEIYPDFIEWLTNNPSCEELEVEEDKCGWVIKSGKSIDYNKTSKEVKFKNRQTGIAGFVSVKIIEEAFNHIMKQENFPMYSELYGKTVTMNDRFETEQTWREELALKNKGKWEPKEVLKQEICTYCNNTGYIDNYTGGAKLDCLHCNIVEKSKQKIHLGIKDNKIELLEEDLQCIIMYLDDLKIPRTDKDSNEYSIVGRIKWKLEKMFSEEDLREALNNLKRNLVEPKQETVLQDTIDNEPIIISNSVKNYNHKIETIYNQLDINHLEWIYNRLSNHHNENVNYDYMIKFKKIIEHLKNK